jgi:high affinity sulfate transporter 1
MTTSERKGGHAVTTEPASRFRVPPLVIRYIPILQWGATYDRAWLRHDLLAGATVWGVMTPVAMAYASMAGLPPQSGLYAAFAALLGYAIFGTSRQLQVTASSTMAVMSAAIVFPLAGGDVSTYIALSAALALVVGLALIVLGLCQLGFVADFLSKSVVAGFIFGLAITIIVRQAPKLFGVPGGSGAVLQQLVQLLTQLEQTNPWTFAVGGGTLALLLTLRRFAPRVPGGLIALILGIAVSSVFHLVAHGVSVVGRAPAGLPAPSFPHVGLAELPALMAGAVGIVFLAVGESIGAARGFADKRREEINANQEFIGLGAANIAAGLVQGFTVDASLSNSATADSAGARTQLSSIVTSALLVITLVALTGLFSNLPNATLGAIVIAAVVGLMNVEELKRYYHVRRIDFWLALTALIGVILTDVLIGLLLAVVLSLVIVLYRASRPQIAVLGKMPGQRASYGDVARHPENERIPGLIIFRLDTPLYFFNVNVARQRMVELVVSSDPPVRAILLDLGASADLDVAALDTLRELVREWREAGLQVLFAQVRGPVRDLVRRTDLMEVIGQDRFYGSVHAAARAFVDAERAKRPIVMADTVADSPPTQDIGE